MFKVVSVSPGRAVVVREKTVIIISEKLFTEKMRTRVIVLEPYLNDKETSMIFNEVSKIVEKVPEIVEEIDKFLKELIIEDYRGKSVHRGDIIEVDFQRKRVKFKVIFILSEDSIIINERTKIHFVNLFKKN